MGGPKGTVTSAAAPGVPGWWGPRNLYSHGHLSVVGGVFDGTGPEIVKYDCDSILLEGSPCIPALDSETYAQLTERGLGYLVQDPLKSGRALNRSTAALVNLPPNTPIVFGGIPRFSACLFDLWISNVHGPSISTLYHRHRIPLSPQHFVPTNQLPLPIPHFFPHFLHERPIRIVTFTCVV